MSALRFRTLTPYAGLAALALGLRLYGLDWGNFHPDEWPIESFTTSLGLPRSLGEFFSPESPLNPGWFNYGSLPLILLAAIGWLGDLLRELNDIVPSRHVLWRAASGAADTVTVILIARIGRTVYGPLIGFLAAAFYALAALPIQLSHYYTVDPLMTTLLIASLLTSISFLRSRNPRMGYLAGILLGMAVATKATAIVFALPAVFAWLAFLWTAARNAEDGGAARRALRQAMTAGLLTLAAFLVGQPYALIDWATYSADVWQQAQMAGGAVELPFTIQYIDTAPWTYHLRNVIVWGLGAPLGIAALTGAALIGSRAAGKRRDLVETMLILSLLIPFLWLGAQQVKFMRYLLPLYPVLCIAAAFAVISAMGLLARLGRPGGWAAMTLAGLVIVPTAFYALALTTVFGGVHPVDRMGEWIRGNVTSGATIATEAWDQRFPGEELYAATDVEVYWPDNPGKVEHLTDVLGRSEYIYMFSNRGYGSVTRFPERFPVMRAYYEGLFSGRLGFEVERVETAYPALLGVSFMNETIRHLGFEVSSPALIDGGTPGLVLNLGPADESFTVYERPKPILFRRVTALPPDEIARMLSAGLPAAPQDDGRSSAPSLLMSADLAVAQDAGGTWTDMLPVTGRGSGIEILFWLLAVQGIALAGFPLATRVFRPLPDHGYLPGKALSLLIVGYLSWLPASLQIMPFSRVSVLAAVCVLAAASALVAYRTRRELLTLIRLRWRWLLTCEVFFLALFLALAALRAANPDLWHPYRGGEKPMDVSYLTAVARSSFMPPYDPWFAGGHLNYYYFGHFIVAALIRLTGAVPEYAVNLAIPLFWTLTVCGVVSIGVNLTEATIRRIGTSRLPGVGSLFVGVAAGLMVGIAGNLDGLLQVGASAIREARAALAGADGGGVIEAILAAGSALTGGDFDYWRSSRMIDVPGTLSITEFPFFSFLFADPHAHVFAMPFALLALGLSLAVALAIHSRRHRLSLLLPFGALALTLGALFAAHSWDYPTYLFAAIATITVARLARGDRIAVALKWGGGAAAALLLVSVLLFAPYHATNAAFYTEIVMSHEQTPIRSMAAIFGLPLLIVIVSLRPGAALALGLRDAGICTILRDARARLWPAGDSGRVFMVRTSWTIGGGALVIGAALMFIAGYGNTALTGVIALAAALLTMSSRISLPLRLAWGAAALAFGLIAAVDVVAVQDHLARMNTIFRVYLQAWILLGISGAYLLWWLIRPGAGAIRMPGISRIYRLPFYGGLAIVILAVSIYPVLGTRDRLADRIDTGIDLTLDGMAFMQDGSYPDIHATEITLRHERDALLWLRGNARGLPVIAEAGLPMGPDDSPYFRIQSRAAVYAGLPVIIGWPWHQTQQRGIGIAEESIEARQRDVILLYASGSPLVISEILDRYDVGYVLVGQTERAYYAPGTVAALERHPRLSLAYENPGVRIYSVLPA